MSSKQPDNAASPTPWHPVTWDELALGEWLKEQEQSFVSECCPRLFGYHLLKLGTLSGQLSCSESLIHHQITMTHGPDPGGIYADYNHLPLQSASIDACVMTHLLEFSPDPHQVLREVERVLTADGTLVISGFNPWSLYGLKRLTRRHSRQDMHLYSPGRIHDWLNLLGFEVLRDERRGFSRFVGKKPRGGRTARLGRTYFRPVASVYVMVARKRTLPLTPVRKRWARVKPRQVVTTACLRSNNK